MYMYMYHIKMHKENYWNQNEWKYNSWYKINEKQNEKI